MLQLNTGFYPARVKLIGVGVGWKGRGGRVLIILYMDECMGGS